MYICGSVEDVESIKKLASFFEFNGFEITRDWWNHIDRDEDSKNFYACEDLIAIKKCDLFVIYEGNIKTSGKYIELGIAIALGKPIFNLNKRLTSVFKVFTKNLTNIKAEQ